MEKDKVRKAVKEAYGKVATRENGCGCDCGYESLTSPEKVSVGLGYSKEDVTGVPKGSNMGLGCGNPQAIALLKQGETVLDLGSGGGFDCFLAAKAVGEKGYVIGVDMTPEMLENAEKNAKKSAFKNVEFRKGEIEDLPVKDNSIDVIISNCVINLSPEKPKVFNEVFRVLKKGGRLAVTDVVTTSKLPDEIKNDLKLHSGCVAGASLISEVEQMLNEADFSDIKIEPANGSKEIVSQWTPDKRIEDAIVSVSIEAVKP